MARSGRPRKIDPIKAIHRAVMDNDVATFGVELADGADINTPGPEDMTPLHIAADRADPHRTEGKNAPLVMIRRSAGFPEDLIELIGQKAKRLSNTQTAEPNGAITPRLSDTVDAQVADLLAPA